jgi:hypothetical protein
LRWRASSMLMHLEAIRAGTGLSVHAEIERMPKFCD